MNKTFCILPWIHLHIWPNGVTYPCCLATNDYVLGNTNNDSFEELWNSERMKQLRKNVLANKPTTGCARCYEHEKQGSKSLRQNMNTDFEHLVHRTKLTNNDGSLDNVYMAYMDIRFSNICNFKCRTCGPELSSFWFDDAKKLGRISHNQQSILKIRNTLDELWTDVNKWIDTVERIYFAGGEPLIMDEHYKILEYLIDIDKTDIYIFYNTNFSKLKYKNKDVISLWKKFKYVKVGASLDAMGDRAELMRKGTKWLDIENNRLRLLKEASHVKFQISSTVSAYNAEHCVDFFDDWISKGWVLPQDIIINVLLFPEYQRAQVLPKHVRKRIQDKLKDYLVRHNLQEVDKNGRSFKAVCAFINSLDFDKSNLFNEFKKVNREIDNLRNEDLHKIFPELVI